MNKSIVSDEKALIEIGKIIVNFSMLEYIVKMYFPQITGVDSKTAKIIIAEMGFKELLNMISIFVKENKKNDFTFKKTILKILEECNQLVTKRNDLIHGHWLTHLSNDKDEFISVRLKKDLSKLTTQFEKQYGGQIKKYSVEKLITFKKEIQSTTGTLLVLMFNPKSFPIPR